MTQPSAEPPERGMGDVAHAAIRAGISLIPFAGSAAVEFFNLVIEPPISRRRDEWMQGIYESLKALEERLDQFSIEALADDPPFVTALLHGSRAAIGSHQSEKLEALRNAVLNTALRNEPDEDLQLMFLNFVDVLTPWHLRILRLADDPSGYYQAHGLRFPGATMGGLGQMISTAFPELGSPSDFLNQLWKDLFDRGLLNTDRLGTTMTIQGVFQRRTTEMGRRFLAFVARPQALS